MRPERPPVQASGVVLYRSPNGVFRVRMPNGYELWAPLDRELDPENPPEDKASVVLEFSTYNMAQGRIVQIAG